MQTDSMPQRRARRLIWVCLIAVLCAAMEYALVSNASAQAVCINCETAGASPTASVTLNGTNQTPTYALVFTASGTLSLGWNLTITSTTFTTASTPHRSLSTTASTITAVSAVCQNGQICVTDPSNSTTYPVTIPAASTAPTAVKFYSVAVATGLGTFTMTA